MVCEYFEDVCLLVGALEGEAVGEVGKEGGELVGVRLPRGGGARVLGWH